MRGRVDRMNALVKVLTEKPLGLSHAETCKILGSENPNGILTMMTSQGYQVAEDDRGGIFLADVREKYIEQLNAKPPAPDGRRHGKLLAAYTGNSGV